MGLGESSAPALAQAPPVEIYSAETDAMLILTTRRPIMMADKMT